MSTHSAIIEKTATGYRGIYCHSDGYLQHVGEILHNHYNTPEKVAQLIALGDLSTLGKCAVPEGPHSYADPEDGVTVAYYRDRGEKFTAPREGSSLNSGPLSKLIEAVSKVYVWDGTQWTHQGKPLSVALAVERFRSADGELETLNTRQMRFEPLAASDLFSPNGYSTPTTL